MYSFVFHFFGIRYSFMLLPVAMICSLSLVNNVLSYTCPLDENSSKTAVDDCRQVT